ncbi:MAG: hypothetical protein Q9159_001329 [Coniocarpon cinnabarinum]
MGAAASLEIRERLRKGTANEIAEDPDFQDFVRNYAWPDAADNLKKFLTEVTHTPRDRLKPLFDADLTVRLAASDMEMLHTLAQGNLDCVVTRVSAVAPTAYINLKNSKHGQESSSYLTTLTRRCQLCIFYSLKEQFERNNLGIKPAAFASTIADSVNEDPTKVQPNVRYWARSGALLHRLASNLGGFGVLFILPASVSRSIWESFLSPNDPRYAEAVDHLRTSGVCNFAEVHGAYKAGTLIADRFGLVQTGRHLSFPLQSV